MEPCVGLALVMLQTRLIVKLLLEQIGAGRCFTRG
jgi:hypothetical protein